MDETLRYDPQQCRIVDQAGETVMEAPSRLYVLYADPEEADIRKRLDALGRKMAAAPELVEVVRSFVAGCSTLAAEFQADTGLTAPGHDVTESTLAEDVREKSRREWVKWLAERAHRLHEEALAALKKAGVEP